ncbi:MAG: DMT family transporter [Rhodobacteraceae bacterium]|nr:DMT family transporter [Paracoccaceae bacterium]
MSTVFLRSAVDKRPEDCARVLDDQTLAAGTGALTLLTAQQRGILTMVFAMFFLSCMDAMVKSMSSRYDIYFLVWVRYLGQALIVLILVLPELRTTLRTKHIALQLARSLCVFAGAVFFFIGLSTIELATATALLQVSPLLIALVAYLTLGESLGWKKLGSVMAGLLGALLIVRPGLAAFDPFSIFPLAAAAAFAGYAVITRFLSSSESVWTSFFYTALIGAVASCLFVPFFWTTPPLADIPVLLMLAGFGTIGQYLVIRALFLAQVSVLAPIGYSSLVFSAAFGMMIFGEFPDMWTILGALMVTASGLFVWHLQTSSLRS